MRLLIALLAAPLCAQLTLSPTTPVVQGGGTATFTASGGTAPYTYTLTSGSLGTFNTSTHVYTAPATVTAPNVVKGCQAHSPSNVYNTRIDALPVHSKSATWMGNITAHGYMVGIGPDFPLADVLSTHTPTTMRFAYTPFSDGNFVFQPFPYQQFETGYYTYNLGGFDRHSLTVERDVCTLEEIYNFYPAGFQAACPTCTSQSGIQYNGMATGTWADGTVDAAGMELLATTLKYEELVSGNITHAMRGAFAFFDPNNHLWPSVNGPFNPSSNGLPYGGRLRLKSSYTPTYSSSCDASCQTVANGIITALKRYGFFNQDVSGAGCCSIQAERAQYPAAVTTAMSVVAGITMSQFDVVDESSLMIAPASSEVNWSNPYVVPKGAQVCVTDAAAATVCQSVLLKGVTIGSRFHHLTVQAGAPAYQLQAWVNGASDTSIAWSMSPTVGSLNATTGVYTAPATTGGAGTKLTTTVTATSNADPTVSISIPLTILPTGTMRIDIASKDADYVDGGGNKWFAELGTDGFPIGPIIHDGCAGGGLCGDYFQSLWSGTSDPTLFKTASYGYNDHAEMYVVANGNYKVTWCSGDNTGTAAGARWVTFDAQGQTAIHNFDVNAGGSGVARCVDIPAKVTDNQLITATRWMGVPPFTANACCTTPLGSQGYAPAPAAISIAADPSSPHITIDYPNPAAVVANQTVQLYAVGWYMSNSVAWAVTSGRGAIDSMGLYTAPSTPPAGLDETVTITATSRVDATKTASVNITLTFGAIQVLPASSNVVYSLTKQMSANLCTSDLTTFCRAYSNVTWSLRTGGVGSINSITGLYSAPASISSDTIFSIVATSTDNVSQSGSTEIDVLARQPDIRYALSDAPRPFTDLNGHAWAGDPCFGSSPPANCGTTSAFNEYDAVTIQNVPAFLNNAGGINMFQGSRYLYYGDAGGTWSETFTVANGTYDVNLYMCDYSPRAYATGVNVFDVAVNGVITNDFDVDLAAGVLHGAVVQSYRPVVTNNTLTITLTKRVGAAMLSGIEIRSLSVPFTSTSASRSAGVTRSAEMAK